MQEKRKIPRSHLIHYLMIFDRESGALIGNLVDITAEGIKFITEARVEEGALLRLRMDFPEEMEGRMFLPVDARCIWCRVDINPDLFAVGCHLENVLAADMKVIDHLIAFYEDEFE